VINFLCGGSRMKAEILDWLRRITPEEQAILGGKTTFDRDLYMQSDESTINAKKLLSAGKLITVRPHTRFIPIPEHVHDYVEVVYMCEGESVHFVNKKKVVLKKGEMLFLNQSATHSSLKTGWDDIAVNFIVLPEFFSTSLSVIGEEETPIRRFLVDCLCGQNTGAGFLNFRVSKITPVQNLVENLLWILINEIPNRRKMSQMTMAILLMHLLAHTDTILSEDEDEAVWCALRYVESNYSTGNLKELADTLHYNVSWLSREIKKKTGKTYTEIVQDKRLAQAAFLLKNTDRNILDIALAVGYENISYFYRIFQKVYGKSPMHFRDEQ